MSTRSLFAKLTGGMALLGAALFAVGVCGEYDGKTTLVTKSVVAVWNPTSERFEGTYILHNGRLTAWEAWPFPNCSCEVSDLPATLYPLSDHVVRFSLKLNRSSSGKETLLTVGSADRRNRIYIPTELVGR